MTMNVCAKQIKRINEIKDRDITANAKAFISRTHTHS